MLLSFTKLILEIVSVSSGQITGKDEWSDIVMRARQLRANYKKWSMNEESNNLEGIEKQNLQRTLLYIYTGS